MLGGGKDSAAAHELVSAGAALVDVRTPGEFASGHIDGARNIPVDQIAARSKEIDKTQPVVVYCRSGARSAAAANTLRGLGFSQVEDLGAMSNW
ncbi:MAG: rhodanese-like domain-containing protein [Myxococcales bacterium]|nr:rhodanese-like domain-containing protein [Myxococcales bacterium]